MPPKSLPSRSRPGECNNGNVFIARRSDGLALNWLDGIEPDWLSIGPDGWRYGRLSTTLRWVCQDPDGHIYDLAKKTASEGWEIARV